MADRSLFGRDRWAKSGGPPYYKIQLRNCTSMTATGMKERQVSRKLISYVKL
jgi:hypothetical protein